MVKSEPLHYLTINSEVRDLEARGSIGSQSKLKWLNFTIKGALRRPSGSFEGPLWTAKGKNCGKELGVVATAVQSLEAFVAELRYLIS